MIKTEQTCPIHQKVHTPQKRFAFFMKYRKAPLLTQSTARRSELQPGSQDIVLLRVTPDNLIDSGVLKLRISKNKRVSALSINITALDRWEAEVGWGRASLN